MRARDRWSALAFSSAFLVVGTIFAVGVESPRSPGAVHRGSADPRVRRRVVRPGSRSARASFLPTQLVFVPMLFLLPLGWVPLATCAGLALGDLADVVRRDLAVGRLVLAPLNSWYSVGPVLVLAAAGIARPRSSGLARYVARARRAVRHGLLVRRAAPALRQRRLVPPSQRGSCLRLLVDAALAPIGLLVAIAAVDHPVAIVFVLPLDRAAGRLRPRASGPDRPRARARPRLPRHRAPARRRRRGGRRVHRESQPRRRGARGRRSRDRLGLNARDASRRGVRGAAPRHRQDPDPIGDHQQARPARRRRMGDDEKHTLEGERMLDEVGGLLGSVGRIVRSCHEGWDGTRLPRRARRRADPARRADRPRLRRLQRDDDRPRLPRGAAASTRPSRSSAAAPGPTSTRPWSKRCAAAVG